VVPAPLISRPYAADDTGLGEDRLEEHAGQFRVTQRGGASEIMKPIIAREITGLRTCTFTDPVQPDSEC
jgi:hypothetical protein